MDSSPGIRSSLTALGRAGLAVTAATAAANLLAYLPPVIGARRLAPADLGALAAALALVAIATMPGVGLQTAVAVAVARSGGRVAEARSAGRGVTARSGGEGMTARSGGRVVAARPTWLTALVCGGVLLLATPVLAAALRLPFGVPPLLAAMTVPAVLTGWPLGVLQGGERFGRLAVGTVVLAFGRYAGVLVGLAAGFGLTSTFALGALLAWSVPPAVWWLLRARRAEARGVAASTITPASPIDAVPGVTDPAVVSGGTGLATPAAPGALRGRAVFAAGSASLAILMASYADLILARRLLPPGESGAYAVGAVLTRAAIWGPQVITIVALPRLVRGGAALRVGLALVVAAGAALVGGTALAGDLVVRAVGGDGYAGLGGLAPYFVLVGALYAVTVFFVNALIADGARRPAAGVWAVVAGLAVVVGIARPVTVGQLLACAAGAAAASALVTGAAVGRRTSRLTSAR